VPRAAGPHAHAPREVNETSRNARRDPSIAFFLAWMLSSRRTVPPTRRVVSGEEARGAQHGRVRRSARLVRAIFACGVREESSGGWVRRWRGDCEDGEARVIVLGALCVSASVFEAFSFLVTRLLPSPFVRSRVVDFSPSHALAHRYRMEMVVCAKRLSGGARPPRAI
jgi:hypothetical protein